MKNEDEPCVYKKVSGVQLSSQCSMWTTFYSLEMTSIPCRVSSLGWGNVFR